MRPKKETTTLPDNSKHFQITHTSQPLTFSDFITKRVQNLKVNFEKNLQAMPSTRDTKLLTLTVFLASLASLSMAQSNPEVTVLDCDSVAKCIGAVGRALAFR